MQCGFCRRGKDVEDVCGPLHMSDDCAAHHKCMQYSALLSQYKFSHFGGFKIVKVLREIGRGKLLKCSVCKTGKNGPKFKRIGGATAGCAINKCRHSYHFYCAKTSDKAITRRIEVTRSEKGKAKKVVLYRVFCSEEHLREFEKKSNDLRYLEENESSDSESDDEEDRDSDPDGDESSVNTPPSQSCDAKLEVSQKNSPKGFCFRPKVKANHSSRSSEDSASSFDSSNSSDARTSGTSAKGLKSQPFLSDSLTKEYDSSQYVGSSSDESVVIPIFKKTRKSPRKNGSQKEGHTSDYSKETEDIGLRTNVTEPKAELHQRIKEDLRTERVESSEVDEKSLCHVGAAQLLGTITAWTSESGTESSSKQNRKEEPQQIKNMMPRVVLNNFEKTPSPQTNLKNTEPRIVLLDCEKEYHHNHSTNMGKTKTVVASKRSREPEDESVVDEEGPNRKKICRDDDITSKKGFASTSAATTGIGGERNESEGYGSATEMCSKGPDQGGGGGGGGGGGDCRPHRELQKVVNSKVPKSVSSPGRKEAPSEDCVLCFLEHDDQENMEYNKNITPIATVLFGVNQDSVYLWKFQADDAPVTFGHMVYFVKDISKAVREKDFSHLSDILCDLEGESIHKHDVPVQYNQDIDRELGERLYHKLRETIRDNLAHASNSLDKNIGSIHYFKSLKTHVVFLYVSNTIDKERKIRDRLGHKNSPFLWTPEDEDIEFAYPTLTSDIRHTLRKNEFEVLSRWIKLNIKKPRLLRRPNSKEPYLFVDRRNSITQRVRGVLEESCSDAQDAVDVITIGPLNKDLIRAWPYLKQCIPAVIEDRLTALNGIYLIYDVDSREVSSMQSLVPRLPSHVDYKVFCGQDPSKSPITCILLQVTLNQENVSSSSSCISESSSVSSSTSTENLKDLPLSRKKLPKKSLTDSQSASKHRKK